MKQRMWASNMNKKNSEAFALQNSKDDNATDVEV